MVAGITILAGAALGGIFPYLGGHGTFSYSVAAPYMLAGGLVGCIPAGFSFLAAKLLVGEGIFARFYIYGWCVVVATVGVILGGPGVLLVAVGIFVGVIRWEVSSSLEDR